ncbi:unnamed protein product [[Candida] boidinii]|nr:unnamed protein product [[Candida] boidinii]
MNDQSKNVNNGGFKTPNGSSLNPSGESNTENTSTSAGADIGGDINSTVVNNKVRKGILLPPSKQRHQLQGKVGKVTKAVKVSDRNRILNPSLQHLDLDDLYNDQELFLDGNNDKSSSSHEVVK